MHSKKIGTIFVRRLPESAKLRLTRAAGSPYTVPHHAVLHRSRETRQAMTTAVATALADPDLAPRVCRTAAGRRAPAPAESLVDAGVHPIPQRFAARAVGQKAGRPNPHAALRAGTA